MKKLSDAVGKSQASDDDRIAIIQSDWLTTNQVGRLLQISPSSLEKARSTGAGPFARLPYHKIGRSVRYRRHDVQAFLDDVKVAGSARSDGAREQ
jgi:hypothetical protein